MRKNERREKEKDIISKNEKKEKVGGIDEDEENKKHYK